MQLGLHKQPSGIKACRFLILFDIHLGTLFSLEQNIFFLEHKLLPVHLTWLHLGLWKNTILCKTPTFDGV